MSRKVTFIIPCYNEEEYIYPCLKSILQCGLGKDDYWIFLSDGGSSDATLDQIKKFSDKNPGIVRLFENTKRKQVYALNQMIENVETDYIIRCDAHAIYPAGFAIPLIEKLGDINIGNVGIPVRSVPGDSSSKAKAISINLRSKIGVGASHRNASMPKYEERDVDTVLFGAWRTEVFKEVGLFDENFIRGQDYEHNFRLLKSGYRIVQIGYDPIEYFTRRNYKDFSKMMMQYASVKPFIYKKYGVFPNFRSLVPFLFYVFLIAWLLTIPVVSLGVFLTYSILMAFGAIYETAREGDVSICCLVFWGFILQHSSHAWGVGVGLLGVLKGGRIDWGGSR